MRQRAACAYPLLLITAVLAACVSDQTADAPKLVQFSGQLAANEELVTIETRPGVTNRVLITKPAGESKGVFLLYPGGEGFLVTASGNAYGAYRRPLASQGYVVAVVDVPSDQPRGLEGNNGSLERFRVSTEHAQDARAVVDALHARWPGKVYLMGHSMGAISVAHITASLEDPRIVATVLMASPSQRGPGGSWTTTTNARLDRIKVPAVVIHHRSDGCNGARFATAADYPRWIRNSPRVGFIAVSGGPPPKSSNPCAGDNYHSFAACIRR